MEKSSPKSRTITPRKKADTAEIPLSSPIIPLLKVEATATANSWKVMSAGANSVISPGKSKSKALKIKTDTKMSERTYEEKITPKSSKPYIQRRETLVPVNVVQQSFKRAFLEMSQERKKDLNHLKVHRESNKVTSLLSSILKVLSTKGVPPPKPKSKSPPASSNKDLNSLEAEDSHPNDACHTFEETNIKIEEVDINLLGESGEPETGSSTSEAETSTIVKSELIDIQYECSNSDEADADTNEILGFLPEDQRGSQQTPEFHTIKMEADSDPLAYMEPGENVSNALLGEECEPDHLMPSSQFINETFPGTPSAHSGPEPSSDSPSATEGPIRNILSVSVSKRRRQRECLVCQRLFMSGDALATHLYTHIFANSAAEQGSEVISSLNGRMVSSSDQVHCFRTLIDPLAIVTTKTEIDPQNDGALSFGNLQDCKSCKQKKTVVSSILPGPKNISRKRKTQPEGSKISKKNELYKKGGPKTNVVPSPSKKAKANKSKSAKKP